MTTQTSVTVANPDGSFTSTTSVMPVRVRQDGAWAAVSARLRKNADGTYSPAATPSALVLSGGGTGPLVTMTSPAGGSLAMTFPFRLPAPAVSGATATYRGVLPGVDLVVTVTDQGGYSDVIVVHDAAAAAALRQVRIATATRGLSVRTDSHGNMTAVGAGGKVAFAAPTPQMWDSAGAGAGAGRRAAAHAAAMGLAAVPGGLVLTPSARMLSARSVRYPLYIDPAVNPASSGEQAFAEAQTGSSNSGDCGNFKNYDNLSTAPLGIGYQNYPGTSCQGIWRSYYAIGLGNLTSDMVVSQATLLTQEQWASDLTCTHTWPVTLKWTGTIGSGTDGNNQPPVDKVLQTMWPRSAATGCGSVDVNFDVTSVIQQGAGQWGNWTFGLFGDESLLSDSSCAPSSSYNCGFMRFGYNPSITTVFDIAPDAPANISLTPAPHLPGGAVDQGCHGTGSDTYGWIGRTDIGAGDGSSVTVNSTVTSNVVGENVRAELTFFDATPSEANYSYANSAYVSSGTSVGIPIGVALQDGQRYGYREFAYDGTLHSTGSLNCYFNADLTPPAVPVISSTDFPQSGSTTSTSLRVGQTGTFTVSSTDPVPTGCAGPCAASGLADFEYSFNTPIPASGAATVPPGTPISFTPSQWGTNIMYVDAVDNAGNRSQVAQYDFYVPFNSAATVTPGDINGDGVPDLLATSTGGNLLLYPGNTDPGVAPVVAGTKATSPDGTGWNTFQITHRGSMSQGTVDDLFAQKGPFLYIYTNGGGASMQFGNTENVTTVTKPACTAPSDNPDGCQGYDATDWSTVTQIVAPGDVFEDGSVTLLTVENDQLLAYHGSFSGDRFTGAVPIGTSGWKNMTLIAPGDVGGVLTLWARDTTTGNLYSYPLNLDSATGLPKSLGPATGTGTAGTLITNITLPAATYPTLTSPGDLTGSGFPGLYAEDTSGNLWFYPGQSTSGGASPLTGTRNLVGAVDNAAAYWPLTEGSGTIANDASGNGLNATLAGGVTWVNDASRRSYVASFNGSSAYMRLPDDLVSSTTSLSFSLWFKTTTPGGVLLSTGQSVIGTNSTSTAGAMPVLYIGTDGKLYGQYWNGGVDPIVSPAAVDDGTWHHVVITGASTTQSLYLDGSLVGSLDGSLVNADPLDFIGAGYVNTNPWVNAPPVGWSYFNGQVSDVEYYTYPLSDPSILPVPQPSTSCGVLTANQGLYRGQSLTSCDGRFTLSMQDDGNLVLYQSGTPLWASGTVGEPSAEMLMQADGSVVIYSSSAAPLWASGTDGNPGADLVVQNDGNLVVYDSGGNPLWASGTCCH